MKKLWLVLLLALCFTICAGQILAKELEGFGDDSDEEFEDDVDELPPQKVTVLKRAPSHVSSSDLEAEDAEEDADGLDEKAQGIGAKDEGSNPETVDQQQVEEAPRKQPVREEWDEEEFEGLPAQQAGRASPGGAFFETKPSEAKPKPNTAHRPQQPRKPLTLKDHIPEVIFLVFLVVFGANYFIGARTNESIALAWAEQFAAEGSIFDKNFSLLGPGDGNGPNEPLMIKEGQSTFKFYASGRRFCECVLITLSLRSRQDLLSVFWNLIFPADDVLRVEVHMNEDSMQPFILAVTRRKAAKSFLKDHKDLKEYCSIVDFTSRKQFPADSLAVITDCREAASELLNDVILDELLGDKAFFKYAARHFISMHFTDQFPGVLKKKILTFEFSLPARDKMGDITKLMASVPYFIDAVAKLPLSSTAKSKAEAARSKAQQAAMKELQEQRLEEMQKRREERRRAEEARMSPAELSKKKEKERLKDLRPKAKLARFH